ncbi:MAG: response regulator [Calditrichaeota bacterium]|nr:response regulator [Calditrichota bacterium]
MDYVSKRILIVDDEEDLTWSLTRNLRRTFENLKIYSTTSGKEAYQILKTKKLDLLISDIKMPDMDGLALLSFVKKNKPDLKVILMTSFENPDYRRIADGVHVHFFEKPFEIENLKKQIQQILRLKNGLSAEALSGHNLIDLIKNLYHIKYSGCLRVQNGCSTGEIYFKAGVIIDAIANRLSGEMALIHLLSWEQVEKAEKLINLKPKQQTVYYGWKMLQKELLAA